MHVLYRLVQLLYTVHDQIDNNVCVCVCACAPVFFVRIPVRWKPKLKKKQNKTKINNSPNLINRQCLVNFAFDRCPYEFVITYWSKSLLLLLINITRTFVAQRNLIPSPTSLYEYNRLNTVTTWIWLLSIVKLERSRSPRVIKIGFFSYVKQNVLHVVYRRLQSTDLHITLKKKKTFFFTIEQM